MKSIYLVELKRAFKNYKYFISLFLGMCICFIQYIQVVLPSISRLDNYKFGKGEYPVSVFNTWIGGSGFTFYLSLYFLVFPLLSSLACGDTLFNDIKGGYINQILSRCDVRDFIKARFVSSYLVGGTIIVAPLLFNLVLTMITIPSIRPESSTRLFPIFEHSMYADLFYTFPYIYLTVYFIIMFMFSGLLSGLSLGLTIFIRNRAMLLVFPFSLYMACNFITTSLGAYRYTASLYLRPDQPGGANIWWIACTVGVMIMVNFILLKILYCKNVEIY